MPCETAVKNQHAPRLSGSYYEGISTMRDRNMATSVLQDNLYWELKIEVLQELRDDLVKNLYPDKFFAYLRAKRVLDKDDCEDIGAERTRRKQAEKFLDILESKGPDAFMEFCEFLRQNKTQLFLLRKIVERFNEKRELLDQMPFPTELPATTPVSSRPHKSKPDSPSSSSLWEHNTVTGARMTTYLPAPGDPGAPEPPEPDNPPASPPMASLSQDRHSASGNAVTHPTSQENSYTGPPPPPYTSLPPDDPPPPYDEPR
ncbi:predicted protein [Nematostella vectensis]|uniref:CARD domain-containing protein n=1 Tax=Nematostella vectensis TaxID=45351 RepID=A7SSM3_NEMVE|nr:serine/threonine-protein kinase WNK4 [Nematostella vectensis]EDO33300.1 predicted protein [Nematostella vectensis]|eukprot:XP_001625400.1 predicted protein [Nematostella vectensis]